MKILNIEDQEKLDKTCGRCGSELTAANRSGWFGFFGSFQIELCVCCHENDKADFPYLKEETAQ